MFVFLDTLTKIQATTYIKIRSTSSEAARSRHDYEKENFAMEKYKKLLRDSFGQYRFTPKMHSFAPQLICANTTSVPLICSSHGYHLRQ
jgi:hypothetical protein